MYFAGSFYPSCLLVLNISSYNAYLSVTSSSFSLPSLLPQFPRFLGGIFLMTTFYYVVELKTWPTYLFLAAGWKVKQCWKNNVGHCRTRCLHTERYKLLCMNKLNCCTPINFEKYTGKPLSPLLPTIDVFPTFLGSRPNDEVTINPNEDISVTETTISTKKVSIQALVHTPKRNDGTTN